MIPIIKIIGILFMLTGLGILAVTFYNARKKGSLEALKELQRIRDSGYTKEHLGKELAEDVYRREPVSETAARMSRRAKRVRQRMQDEERAGRPGMDPGTSAVEEVTQRRKRSFKDEAAETTVLVQPDELPPVPGSEEATDILSKDEESTGLLPGTDRNDDQYDSESGTDVLGVENRNTWSEEDTGLLPSAEDATGLLGSAPEESTDILPSSESGTDILSISEDGTDILPSEEQGTDILPSRV